MKTIREFARELLAELTTPANADLIARYLAAGPSIETQINVRTDIGEVRQRAIPGGGVFNYRTDGSNEFWPIRWPKDARCTPQWDTMPDARFHPKYASDIGSTGHAEGQSLWAGFDIDASFGHAEGLSADQLANVERALSTVDFVELRRSTSGKGLHAYVLLDGVATANHTEHAAIARAIHGKLCVDAGLPFDGVFDCYGSILWIASRRQNAESFALIKPARRKLTPADIPANWREHVQVVTRKRKAIPVGDDDQFAELASGHSQIAADDEHRRILDAYAKTGFAFEHNPDYGCYKLHTVGLAKSHEELGLRGVFRTQSPGSEPQSPNCYAFLKPGGMLLVVRYHSQTEDPCWNIATASGERAILFNAQTDLRTACSVVGAVWAGKFCTCHNYAQAKRLADLFGFELPALSDRCINFRYDGADTIAVEATQLKGDTPPGWAVGYRKLMLSFPIESPPAELYDYESFVRHVITPERENAGYLMRDATNAWNFEPKDTCKERLAQRFGVKSAELPHIMGAIAANPYTLVNEPYQSEFLPGRQWNKFGAQLAIAETYGGKHPHFDMILRHVGLGLDAAVAADEWCIRNGVRTGEQFFRIFSASIVQRPKQHLPFLYLYSRESNTGKSSFHRSLAMLFHRGAVEGARTLNEQFNKMLAGAVLVYLDEERVDSRAAQKVKLWTDSDKMSIRAMRTDSFMFDNFTHWVASYNFTDGLPIEPGDERVIMVEVPPLMPDELLDWKTELRPALEAEASDFLGTLRTMELPPSAGRLYLPVLMTDLKRQTVKPPDDPTCDREELLARVCEVFAHGPFAGKSRDLLAKLGNGSWSNSPNHLRRYLKEIAPELLTHGITVEFPTDRRITLGAA